MLSERLRHFCLTNSSGSRVASSQSSSSTVTCSSSTTTITDAVKATEIEVKLVSSSEEQGLLFCDADTNSSTKTTAKTNEQISDMSRTDAAVFNDFGRLSFNTKTNELAISQELHTEIVRGSAVFQNKEGPFTKVDGRGMCTSWFTKSLGNGRGGGDENSSVLVIVFICQRVCALFLLFVILAIS